MKDLVEETLNQLPHVKWDRFVQWGNKIESGITCSGWIDREDTHKDYVCVDIYPKDKETFPDIIKDQFGIDYMTSSAKYSLPMFKMLNRGNGRGHRKCKRIEHYFNINNVIKL